MWTISTCLLLFFLTCTEAQSKSFIKSVTLSVQPSSDVERGTNMTLTCRADVSHDGGYSPQYTYKFYKDYKPIQTLQSTVDKDQVTFFIPEARAFHSGNYYCELKIEKQLVTSNNKDVNIKGLQTPELIVDKVVVREGEAVTANCTAVEEMGSLTFSFKDGSKERYREETSKGYVQKTFIFRAAKTERLSCSYAINVANRRLESNTSGVHSIQVQELSIKPTIKIQPSTDVIEGDTVNILCIVDESHQNSPSLSLQLINGKKILKSDMNQSEYSKMAQPSDAGEYECNAQVNHISKTASANLTVRELFSQPILTISPADVFEKQSLTITCHSSDYASERIQEDEVKYYIYRDKELLTVGAFDGKYVVTAGMSTNGNYTCRAQVRNINKQSQPQIFTAKVLVSRPIISVIGQVVLGKTFHIQCLSENGSFPITYKLKRKNRVLNQIQVRSLHDHSIFTSNITSENEIQDFKCEAQNSRDFLPLTSETLSAPVVVPVGETLLTVIPDPNDITENEEVTLICSISKGSHPISFRWYRLDNHSPLQTNTVMRNYSTHILHTVSVKDSGSYFCEAFNEASVTVNSNKVEFTVRMAPWKISIIVVLCVVVLMVVVVLLMRHRAKRGAERPDELNVEYMEVLHPKVDPTRVPLKKGTDTVYSELQTPPQDFFF